MRRRGRFGPSNRDAETVSSRLSRMVEPAVLYLIACEGGVHGYDLIQATNELGLSEATVDAGAIYRCLRQLEADGCVTSAWDTSRAGPARRTYEITPDGRQRLAAWAATLERRAEALHAFLDRCADLLSSSDEEASTSESAAE